MFSDDFLQRLLCTCPNRIVRASFYILFAEVADVVLAWVFAVPFCGHGNDAVTVAGFGSTRLSFLLTPLVARNNGTKFRAKPKRKKKTASTEGAHATGEWLGPLTAGRPSSGSTRFVPCSPRPATAAHAPHTSPHGATPRPPTAPTLARPASGTAGGDPGRFRAPPRPPTARVNVVAGTANPLGGSVASAASSSEIGLAKFDSFSFVTPPVLDNPEMESSAPNDDATAIAAIVRQVTTVGLADARVRVAAARAARERRAVSAGVLPPTATRRSIFASLSEDGIGLGMAPGSFPGVGAPTIESEPWTLGSRSQGPTLPSSPTQATPRQPEDPSCERRFSRDSQRNSVGEEPFLFSIAVPGVDSEWDPSKAAGAGTGGAAGMASGAGGLLPLPRLHVSQGSALEDPALAMAVPHWQQRRRSSAAVRSAAGSDPDSRRGSHTSAVTIADPDTDNKAGNAECNANADNVADGEAAEKGEARSRSPSRFAPDTAAPTPARRRASPSPSTGSDVVSDDGALLSREASILPEAALAVRAAFTVGQMRNLVFDGTAVLRRKHRNADKARRQTEAGPAAMQRRAEAIAAKLRTVRSGVTTLGQEAAFTRALDDLLIRRVGSLLFAPGDATVEADIDTADSNEFSAGFSMNAEFGSCAVDPSRLPRRVRHRTAAALLGLVDDSASGAASPDGSASPVESHRGSRVGRLSATAAPGGRPPLSPQDNTEINGTDGSNAGLVAAPPRSERKAPKGTVTYLLNHPLSAIRECRYSDVPPALRHRWRRVAARDAVEAPLPRYDDADALVALADATAAAAALARATAAPPVRLALQRPQRLPVAGTAAAGDAHGARPLSGASAAREMTNPLGGSASASISAVALGATVASAGPLGRSAPSASASVGSRQLRLRPEAPEAKILRRERERHRAVLAAYAAHAGARPGERCSGGAWGDARPQAALAMAMSVYEQRPMRFQNGPPEQWLPCARR